MSESAGSPDSSVARTNSGDRFRIVVLLSGRGSNFQAILEHIERNNLAAEVALVVSDRAGAAGLEFARSRKLPTALVERRAKERSADEFTQELVQCVRAASPDLIVLAGFMRVLDSKFIDAFAGRIINIHPSLLPAFRGLNAQAQAIAAGVKFAGCTVHLVEPEVDGGPIIAQAVVPVFADDSPATLADRILHCEHKLFPAVVERFIRRELTVEIAQDGALTVTSLSSCKPTDRILSLDR